MIVSRNGTLDTLGTGIHHHHHSTMIVIVTLLLDIDLSFHKIQTILTILLTNGPKNNHIGNPNDIIIIIISIIIGNCNIGIVMCGIIILIVIIRGG